MPKNMSVEWELFDFEALGTDRLYKILKARSEIFGIEQNCLYCDLDDFDRQAHHLIGFGEGDEIAAYLRIVEPGVAFGEVTFGRIITTAAYRGMGLGHTMMKTGIQRAESLYPGLSFKMASRGYLQGFYEQFGFHVTGEPYEAFGITFVDMVRNPA